MVKTPELAKKVLAKVLKGLHKSIQATTKQSMQFKLWRMVIIGNPPIQIC